MELVQEKPGLFVLLLIVAAVFVASIFTPIMSFNVGSTSSAGTVELTQDDSLLYANATILEVISGHAWAGHGTEVNDAIRCLNNKGSSRTFQTFGFKDDRGNPLKTNLFLCQDGDDWYAIVTTTLEKVGGNRIGRLITAYLVDKRKFLLIDEFINVIKEKWLAREVAFIIEAGAVFLQPK